MTDNLRSVIVFQLELDQLDEKITGTGLKFKASSDPNDFIFEIKKCRKETDPAYNDSEIE